MAALIETEIPSQFFESIRDVIGAIIKTEYAKQYELSEDEIFNSDVYIERSLTFNAETDIIITNVCYKGTDYLSKDPKYLHGEHVFTVEVTTTGKYSKDGTRGDYNAAVKLHKLLGVCRYILSSIEYRFLGLEPGIVMGTMVKSIKIYPPDPVYNPTQSSDANSVQSGVLLFSVSGADSVGDVEGINIDEIFTNMTIENSDKGYKILIINT